MTYRCRFDGNEVGDIDDYAFLVVFWTDTEQSESEDSCVGIPATPLFIPHYMSAIFLLLSFLLSLRDTSVLSRLGTATWFKRPPTYQK